MKKILWGICLCALSVGAAFAAMSTNEFMNLCANGTPEQVQAAINAGANVNTRDKYGKTMLMFAAHLNRNPGVVALLINAGADVNAKDNGGLTVLMFAALHRHLAINNSSLEIVIALIGAGADVNARGKNGITALKVAAQYNANPRVITALIGAGADVNARDEIGVTALGFANFNKTPAKNQIIAILKEHAQQQPKVEQAKKPKPTDKEFMELCKQGTPQQVSDAINAGANVNARGNEKNKEGWTPLHWAANKNPNPQVIDVLLKSGADVNARNKNQGTPLMWAASDNTNPEVLKTLIASWGADVNAKSVIGLTALMLAAQNNPNPQIIETLIDFKADVYAKDKDGNKAFDHAKRNNNIKNSAAYQRLGGGSDSGYKRRYMVCTGDNVSVRNAPNAKSKTDTEIEKNEYVLVVDERKNSGEERSWYKIVNERFDKEQVLGWVYGQYLRNTIEKKNVDMGLNTLNGIAWGTPHSKIKGISALSPAPKEDKRGWKFSAQTKGSYREDSVYLPVAEITYLFDSEKRLIGADVSVDFDDDEDDTLSEVDSYLGAKLGETQNIERYSGCHVQHYEFDDFKVAFGWAGETTFYYYVQKK